MKWSNRSLLAFLVTMPVGCGARLNQQQDDTSTHGSVVEANTDAGTMAPEQVSATPDDAASTRASDTAPNAGSEEVASTAELDAPSTAEPDAPSTNEADAPSTDEVDDLPLTPCEGELHFVSLYQATASGSSDVAETAVHIERPGSHVLVLSASSAVRWTISAAPGASLERVIINGYELQEAVLPDGVPLELHSYESGEGMLFDTAYTWSLAWGLGNPSAPVSIIEAEAERPLTTFTGCYDASHVTVHADASVSLDCVEGPPSLHVNPPCEASSLDFLDTGTSGESVAFIPDATSDAWCWMLEPRDYGTLALHQVDPANGDSFEVAEFTSPGPEITSSFTTSGLALLDGRLVFSGYMGNNFQWAQIDLGTSAVTIAGSSNYVDSVASNGSELIVPCTEDQLCTFDGFADLARGNPSRRIPAEELWWGTSFTVRGDSVYSARFSGSEVFVHDLQTGAKLNTIPLEGFADWNHGISLTADRLYVSTPNRADSLDSPACIITFDPVTGAELNRVCVEGEAFPTWSGLWCDGVARE